MISDSIGDFIDFIIGIGPWAWATGVLLVVVLALAVAFVKTRRGDEPAEPKRERHPEDILTIVAAGIATAVSAQGMWQFFERVLGPGTLPNGKLDPDNPGVHWPLRLLLFAFIEVAMVTSAYRARRSMSERHHAGVDGLAVWALTCLSAVLSTLEARSFAEHVFRLAAPLVAAWLWERGMAIQRVRLTGRGRINWRLTPERIFVRLGLAEPSERTAGEVDATRRLTKVALAAGRYDDARWKVLRVDARPRAEAQGPGDARPHSRRHRPSAARVPARGDGRRPAHHPPAGGGRTPVLGGRPGVHHCASRRRRIDDGACSRKEHRGDDHEHTCEYSRRR
jgi:hypothetical protein